MKKQWNLTTQKTTRGFVVNIVKYNDYQTLDNYKNHTEKKKQRTHKEHTNHTIIEEWKNERMNNRDKEKEKIFWDTYPHARKWKKQDAIKFAEQIDVDVFLNMVSIYKREVAVWMQDAKYVPACERWARDFVPYSDTMQETKLKQIYYKLLDDREVEKIKQFTQDFWEETIMKMYNKRKEEQRNQLLSSMK